MKKSCVVALLLIVLALASGSVASEEKITLTVWSDWSQALDVFQELAAIYMERNPHVEVIWEYAHGKDRLVVSILGGTAPDIVCFGLPVDLIEAGMIEPLDEYLKDSPLLGDIPEVLWSTTMYQGKTYGIPAIEGGPNWGLFFNVDRFQRAGLPLLDTERAMNMEEFLSLQTKLTTVDAAGKVVELGFFPEETAGTELVKWEGFFNTSAVDTQSMRAQFNNEQFHQAAEVIEKLWQLGGGYSAMLEYVADYGRWPGPSSLFVLGKTALMHAGYWAVQGVLDGGMSIEDFGVTWSPQVDGLRVQIYSGWKLLLLSGSPHKEEAFKLMEFIAGGESQAFLFEKLGWLGGLPQSTFEYISPYSNPQIAWFLDSMSLADIVFGVDDSRRHPFGDEANELWYQALQKIATGQASPAQALEEANHLLQVEIDKRK